mmetsp:Transcript_50309/g.161493  ORF Transcript_50309/g.161493 Transcript_50309/m.161493 type:complete len:462 (+) Transcript_50309:327-1712(+)
MPQRRRPGGRHGRNERAVGGAVAVRVERRGAALPRGHAQRFARRAWMRLPRRARAGARRHARRMPRTPRLLLGRTLRGGRRGGGSGRLEQRATPAAQARRAALAGGRPSANPVPAAALGRLRRRSRGREAVRRQRHQRPRCCGPARRRDAGRLRPARPRGLRGHLALARTRPHARHGGELRCLLRAAAAIWHDLGGAVRSDHGRTGEWLQDGSRAGRRVGRRDGEWAAGRSRRGAAAEGALARLAGSGGDGRRRGPPSRRQSSHRRSAGAEGPERAVWRGGLARRRSALGATDHQGEGRLHWQRANQRSERRVSIPVRAYQAGKSRAGLRHAATRDAGAVPHLHECGDAHDSGRRAERDDDDVLRQADLPQMLVRDRDGPAARRVPVLPRGHVRHERRGHRPRPDATGAAGRRERPVQPRLPLRLRADGPPARSSRGAALVPARGGAGARACRRQPRLLAP